METLSQYNKAWVSLLMSVLIIIEYWTGWKASAIGEDGVIAFLALLTPILVWLTPNRT